ncbi:hypothetical protein SDJN02_18621, partial [Cucurbita argyrosperma subsp. argyrosperma]
LCMHGDDILEEAQNFSSHWLNAWVVVHVNHHSATLVHNTLLHPYHKSLPQFMLPNYFGDKQWTNKWIHTLQGVAKVNFNTTQRLRQYELNQFSKWWKESYLGRELNFARNQPMKWYIASLSCLTDVCHSEQRIQLAKAIAFVYLIDDIFDVFGTLEELTMFTEVVCRWDLVAAEKLPSCMRICFKSLFEVTNEISDQIYQKHVSTGVHVTLVHVFFLLGQQISNQTVELLEEDLDIVSCSATILRLWDDMGSAKDENQEGHDGSYVKYYMKEHPSTSFSATQKHIMWKISEAWKSLNREWLYCNPLFPSQFTQASLNIARAVPLFYSYGRNQSLPTFEQHMERLLFHSLDIYNDSPVNKRLFNKQTIVLRDHTLLSTNFKPNRSKNQSFILTDDDIGHEAPVKGRILKHVLREIGDPWECLNLIDATQRLGIDYHFQQEIEAILQRQYVLFNAVQLNSDTDLHKTAFLFRLFRQHGYLLCMHGDEILEEAENFSSHWLKARAEAEQVDHHLASFVQHTLAYPHHKSVVQLMAPNYLEDVQWWKETDLAKDLSFSRDQPIKWYVASLICLSTDSFYSEQRIQLAKSISFIYLIDDIFDWAKLCKAFLVEAEWMSSGQSPSAEEYLKNGVVSTGVHVTLTHVFFLLGEAISKETVELFDEDLDIISSSATVLRLWDDMGSAKDEKQEGRDGSYLEYYMKEHPSMCYEETKRHTMKQICNAWKTLNTECLLSNLFPAKFNQACLNLARVVPIAYNYASASAMLIVGVIPPPPPPKASMHNMVPHSQKWTIPLHHSFLPISLPADSQISPSIDETSMKYEFEMKNLKHLLRETAKIDSLESLNMIDAIQRLGIDHCFKQEIKPILQTQYTMETHNFDAKCGLHHVALRFRLLRQHGYFVPQDVFEGFIHHDHEDLLDTKFSENIEGLTSLYEASQLCLPEDEKLEKIGNFSARILKKLVRNRDDNLGKHVRKAMANPFHKSLVKFVVKDHFGSQSPNKWIYVFQHMAKLDFNRVQKLHGLELSQFIMWWKKTGLCEELKFARDQPLKWYICSMAFLADPMFSEERVELTKCISFIYLIDDIYDVYGSLEELRLFTKAIQSARERISHMISDAWKRLNQESLFSPNPYPPTFIQASLNIARFVPLLYGYDENQDLPTLEKLVKFVLYENVGDIFCLSSNSELPDICQTNLHQKKNSGDQANRIKQTNEWKGSISKWVTEEHEGNRASE